MLKEIIEKVQNNDTKINKKFEKIKDKIINDIKNANLEERDIFQAAKDDLGEYLSNFNPISSKEKTWFNKESFEEAEDYFYENIDNFAKIIYNEII
jgi:hypothetical protein